MAPQASPNIPSTVNDFHVLPLHIPALSSFPHEATHYLYIRAHAPKVPSENTHRELFLVNVPIDATDVHISSLFAEQLGGVRVEGVAFEGARVGKGISAPVAPVKAGTKRKRGAPSEDGTTQEGEEVDVGILPAVWDRYLHRSGSTAIVTFVDKSSADLALKHVRRAVKAKAKITWGSASVTRKVPPLGSARYSAHHRQQYPSPTLLQSSVDAYMSTFNAAEEARAKLLARQRSEPDEDGFITVTRGARNGPAREAETRARAEELERREKERVQEGFYRFQNREKRKERAKDLARSFEEDARRVAEMKQRRGRVRPE